MFELPLVALLTLSVLPAVAQQSGDHERTSVREPSGGAGSARCEEPRPVVLETGISIDVDYCGSTPEISTTQKRVNLDQGPLEYTPGTFPPRNDVKYFVMTTYNIRGYQDVSSAYVFVYKPEGDWRIPRTSLNTVGAGILTAGDPLTGGDGTGWVVKQDSRLNQQGEDWLPARQIIEEKSDNKSLRVYFRIIIDTRRNTFYYLYQRTQGGCAKTEDNCGLDQANRVFNSFRVDPDSASRP